MANYNLKAIPEAMKSVAKRGNIRVHVSETNSKLGCIPAFNLLPMVTCSVTACKTCLKEGCYAVKNLFRCGYNVEKNTCFNAWTENTVLAKTSLFTLQVELEKYLLKKQPRFFRIHASGDFFSVGYATIDHYTVLYHDSIEARKSAWIFGTHYDIPDGGKKVFYHLKDVTPCKPYELPAERINHGRAYAQFFV